MYCTGKVGGWWLNGKSFTLSFGDSVSLGLSDDSVWESWEYKKISQVLTALCFSGLSNGIKVCQEAGREVKGGDICTSMANLCWYMAEIKPIL